MPGFRPYAPNQALLLPPHVKDVLGADHVCFLIHEVVERMDLRCFEEEYSEEGSRPYAPALMLKVWLYAYALGMHSSRRLEQRIVEDLAFRFLAGGAHPDHWTLNDFRRRHARGVNDTFTQVLEWARQQGLARLGYVAIDSTRVAANASRNKVDTMQRLRQERAKIRRRIRAWQKACDQAAGEEASSPTANVPPGWQERLASIPKQLEKLRKAGLERMSRTDPDSRFLRDRGGFTLGYSGEMAVSEDHIILAQRVTQNSNDNGSLVPLVEEVEKQCGARPHRVGADTGFYSNANLEEMERRGIDAFLPDSQTSHELRGGCARPGVGQHAARAEVLLRMRAKLRTPAGREQYALRKKTVEPVFGILKEQRGMRRFRRRRLAAVAVEFALACTAHNLLRIHQQNKKNST